MKAIVVSEVVFDLAIQEFLSCLSSVEIKKIINNPGGMLTAEAIHRKINYHLCDMKDKLEKS